MSIIPEQQAFGWDDPPSSSEAPPTLSTFDLWFPWAAIAAIVVVVTVVAVTGEW